MPEAAASGGLVVWGAESPRSMRVVWTALEMGLDFERRPVESRSGETTTAEYTALNPKQKIPTLRHGAMVLSESAAIVAYLTAAFPAPPGFLVPEDPVTRARLDEWCYFVMTELDAHTLYLIRRHDGLKHIYGDAPVAVESAKTYFRKQVDAVAGQVEAAGRYLLGEEFSAADIVMMTTLDWALFYGIALPPEMDAYRDRVALRPCYGEAMALNYPKRLAARG
ncbi:MAG: glutathione S-transferase family protein [Alphaproteobacteria bacterium]|nr:glutathione S-transferase family protein [Alphaproteobacteria bacterium]MDP6515513.1 glutathione S-transferase family protein [Alphaproteobacteria bacterium]